MTERLRLGVCKAFTRAREASVGVRKCGGCSWIPLFGTLIHLNPKCETATGTRAGCTLKNDTSLPSGTNLETCFPKPTARLASWALQDQQGAVP